MQKTPFQRMYILLRPAGGQATGFARMECQRGRGRLSIHASGLPERPVRALLLYGWLHPQPKCTLWQMQEVVERYLAYPAADSAPAPVEYEEKQPERSVLMLRRRVST